MSDEEPATLVRPLVGESRFYAVAYALLATAFLAASRPALDLAFVTLTIGAMFGLFGAWREGRTVFRREPTPLRRDAARLESPRVRLARRLRLGHLPRRGRAVLAGLFLAALVTGLVTGADRVEAAGGLFAMVLVYVTAHNLVLAGHFA